MAKRIIIIGGGPAGLFVANGLSESAERGLIEVVILEKKDHADLVIGQPRALVNGAFADEALLPYDRVLKGKRKPRVITVSAVTALRHGNVSYITREGRSETLSADAFVVATGSSHRGKYIKNSEGLSKQEWLQKLSAWRTAAGNARHILIVGGGVTGVEVAGELATEHPNCKVTIVHSGNFLCDAGGKMHASILAGLNSLPGKVEVITADKVQAEETLASVHGPQTFITAGGIPIVNVDMVVSAAGVYPNTAFIERNSLDSKGYIVVDSTLQAPALTSPECPVFAVGDVAHCGWGRLSNAKAMAEACVKNLRNLLASKPPAKVYNTEGNKNQPIFASLGRKQAVGNAPVVNKWLARKIKAPSLMVGIAWPMMVGVKDFKLSPTAMGPSPLSPTSLQYAAISHFPMQGYQNPQYAPISHFPMQGYENPQQVFMHNYSSPQRALPHATA